MSFTNIFGGSAVSPADVAYAPYSFSADLVLYWPQFANGQPDVAARFMNLTATVGGLDVFMPDATLVSVGYDVIIFNAGSNTFNVVNSTGGAIATIPAGQTYYLLLTDNTTVAGTWQTIQFGVGTGSASAAALAGKGLIALAGLLNVNLDAELHSIDYNITAQSRAMLQVWTGGSGIVTLPTAGSVGDGFFFPIANNGTGSVTVATSGGEQIDGASSSVFTQTQSAFVVSSGSAWYTVGKGLQNNFAVTLLNLNVAGSSDIIETGAQAQNVIQQFTGILTGNINVIVPNTVQLYYCFNNTSGSFTLTVKTAAGTGFVVPQGEHVILYCDGTNVLSAFSTTIQIVGSATYSIGTAGGTANALTGNASNYVLQLGTVVWFSPSLPNSGAATLNVQGTGVIPFKKITPGGLVDLAPGDLAPGVPYVTYYNGTYYVLINIFYSGYYETISTNSVLTFASLFNSIDITAAINLTLPPTIALPPYFYVTLFANNGAVTLVPDAADSIQGGTAGANYVIPSGGSAKLVTDGAGKWTLFTYSVPFISNDNALNATVYPVWSATSSGNNALKASSTKLSFNPSTGAFTSTSFIGNLTGNVTGDITGSAPAANLTGTTLAANVVNSSLTSVGTLVNLTVTNPISGSITGSAATLTTGRTIAITGDLTYTSPSFNGSSNVTAAGTLATVNSNVGTFTNATITVNAKGLITAASSGAGVVPAAMTILTASGTWNSPSDVTSATVFEFTVVGGGGGGGGTNAAGAAAGGGAGGTAVYVTNGLAASTGYSYTIGAGGAGGASGANDGTAGSASSITLGATTPTGGGGALGLRNTATTPSGGAGGTASNGTLNLTGGAGGGGSNANVIIPGGVGGNSFLGAGGAGGGGGSTNGAGGNGGNYGGGGGGAGGNGLSRAGGNGANGVIIIKRLSG